MDFRMATITLDFGPGQLQHLRGLGPRVQRALVSAARKAGGDAVRAMRVVGRRTVRARKRMKSPRVTKAFTLAFPRGPAAGSLDGLEWRMDVSRAPVPLSEYPIRQVKAGVQIQVNRSGARALVRSAFLATMRSGHRGVFRRRGDKRLPIDELFTTRVSDVFGDAGVIPATYDRAQTVFSSAFQRLLALELAR